MLVQSVIQKSELPQVCLEEPRQLRFCIKTTGLYYDTKPAATDALRDLSIDRRPCEDRLTLVN